MTRTPADSGSPEIRVGPGGYVAVRFSPPSEPFDWPPPDAVVRLIEDEGDGGTSRWIVCEVHVDDIGVSAERLAEVPLAAVEAWANSVEGDQQLQESWNIGAGQWPDFETPSRHVLRSRKRARGMERPPALEPPGAAGLDDDFLRRLDSHYRYHLANGRRPNASIARELGSGYTAKTVSKWVEKGRRRGLIAKAPRRGRAG